MRTGRPQKPDNQKKDYYVRIRLTKEQNDMLNECCELKSISKTEVLTIGLEIVYEDFKNGK